MATTDREQIRRIFRALTELAPALVALPDGDGVIKYVSHASERLLELHPLHPDDIEAAGAGFKKLLGTAETVKVRTRIRRKDGSWADLESFGRNDPAFAARRSSAVRPLFRDGRIRRSMS